jgi:hypothetical protein
VIYLPRTERQSHYFSAQMAVQFDAVIHIDWRPQGDSNPRTHRERVMS